MQVAAFIPTSGVRVGDLVLVCVDPDLSRYVWDEVVEGPSEWEEVPGAFELRTRCEGYVQVGRWSTCVRG